MMEHITFIIPYTATTDYRTGNNDLELAPKTSGRCGSKDQLHLILLLDDVSWWT